MAEFSAKERMIASMLSSMPGLKKGIKNIYIRLNALVYRKPYKIKLFAPASSIHTIEPEDERAETFFGYYDKPCERNGMLVYHRTLGQPTEKKPLSDKAIEIVLRQMSTGKDRVIATTNTYNWQQGARSQWLSDREIIFNTIHDNVYSAAIFNTENERTVYLPYPVQEALPDGRYLSINYARIMRLRPDYGYRNFPVPSDEEMADMDGDGILLVNPSTGQSELLHSLTQIASVNPKPIFERCTHVVNHVMSSPDGNGFIFIHRFYEGGRRHDRLMYSDFKNLRVLADDDMVSHCHWLDNNTIVGYLRNGGKDAFYLIDLSSGEITLHDRMSSLKLGDGHPSVCKRYIAFDSYPDKSRMQHLFLLDRANGEISPLAELHHSVSYMDESRCDLHPRFSDNGHRLYFDTVYSGRRRLAYIDLPDQQA